MDGKYSKFLTVLLVVIIAGVVGLLGYLGYNYLSNDNIEQEADEYVQTFTGVIGSTSNTTEEENVELESVNSATAGSTVSTTYKGFDVIGTIEIPKTDIKYPILAKVSTKSLNVSVAALYPKDAVMNTVGNVVIVGHNYRNGLFFSNNKNLSNGDKIYITDLNGDKVTYIIYNIFEADENDTSFYNRDTNGAREITLSTCTDDSSARTIIEAKAEGD